ncbi:MAG: TonB-dependent receptor plug domain-containing protein [Campylobacteraceae bacterium]|jgi:hypothetical protein|nr:TonB-dependent receptor plug domain-containing protein [Campylobacteraceae bacterium]
MYFQNKMPTLLAYILLFCPAMILADENIENVQLMQIDVKARAENSNNNTGKDGKGGKPTIISNDYIKNAPSATSTVTDLLRGKSYIQYDQTSRSGATGGEISPPKVSINGAKHYENSFLINGVGNNNNINPSGLPLGISTQTGQPTGETQTLFLDTSLFDTVLVYTENVGAEYGGFLGGVIDAKMRDANMDRWHINATYRYTNEDWAKFHWTDAEKAGLNSTTTAELQPKFTKYEYTVSADGPLSDNFGLMLSYGKKESKIPLWSNYYTVGNSTSLEKRVQYREMENFLVKLNTYGFDDFKASFTAIYAPYEHTLFIPSYKNSDYSIDSGGYTLIYDMENDFMFGKLKNTINYQKNELSRVSDRDFLNQWDMSYPSNGYINWGTGSIAYEGAFGDYLQDRQSVGYKGIFEFDEIQSAGLEHTIKAGIEAEYTAIKSERGKYTIFYAGVADPTVTGSKDNGILEGSQYSVRTVSGMQQKRDKDFGNGALFVEDSIKIDRFTVRPGLRISTDSITDNTDISWRFFANADVFNDDMLNVYGGYNRYYGTQILSYATFLPIKTYISTRANATSPWIDQPSNSTNPQYNLGNLENPYSDELNIGASLNIYDTLFNIKLVNRENRKEIRSVRPISSTNTYREFTNSGESSYWGVTLLVSKDYDLGMGGKHSSNFSITRSDSKSNSFDPVGAFDYDDVAGTVSTTHITYNNDLMPMEDVRNSADFNRPWVVAYTHMASFNYFDLGAILRWQSGAKGMIRLAGFGHNDPDGIRTVAFEDVDYGSTFNVDLSMAANVKIKNNKLKIGVDILNLLNNKNDASAYYGVLTSRGVTSSSLGRQFFANFRYEY